MFQPHKLFTILALTLLTACTSAPAGQSYRLPEGQQTNANTFFAYYEQAIKNIMLKEGIELTPIHLIAPNYSESLRRSRITGLVRVLVEVDGQGNVANTEVTQGTHPDLARISIHAIKSWKFHPPKKDGQAIERVKFYVPLSFTLQQS